ncbi:sensor histidine kinase [Bacillus sp. AK128]
MGEIKVNSLWGWTDWFVVGLRFFFTFLIGNLYIYKYTEESLLGLVITLSILAYAVPQLFYLPNHIRPRLFIITEILLSGGYTLFLIIYFQNDLNGVSYFYIPILVIGYVSTKKSLYWVIPICLGIFPIAVTYLLDLDTMYHVNLVINLAMFGVFGYSFGVFLRQKNKLSVVLTTLEEKNRELEHYIGQVERVTLLEERNRMSRELHDTVGHSLTASIVAMEAVQTLLNRDLEAANQRLSELINYSRSNLDKFRQTVHDMAMNELKLSLEQLLQQTAEEFSNQTGTSVTVSTESVTSYIPESVKLALLRCMQESLTNAKKHGNASEVFIELKIKENFLILTVQDNGSGSDHVEDGFGIEGMRERIETLRGGFHITSKLGKGTAVSCSVPLGV